MAKTVYVDSIYGLNSNNGLTPGAPKQTILGARSATVAGDLVLIAPGLYLEGNALWNSGNDANVLYMADPSKGGKVIVDFQNVEASNHWNFNPAIPRFMGIHFRNPGIASSSHFFSQRTTTYPRFYHCVFYNQHATPAGQVMLPSGTASGRGEWWFCSFYNLNEGAYCGWSQPVYSNYFVDVTTPIQGAGSTQDYNAYPGNGEANGINTSTGANPGFVNAAGGDFTLDPDTTPADYAAFMTSGVWGNRIGAFGGGGYLYFQDANQLRWFNQAPTVAQGNPQPGWENDTTYTDGTPGDIIETAGALEIDLITTPAATGGRVRSDVFSLAAGTNLIQSFALGTLGEDVPGAPGAAIDTNTTLPKQLEYRSQSGSFLKDDGTPTWTLFEKGVDLSVSGHDYFQLRITFRTDHTNA